MKRSVLPRRVVSDESGLTLIELLATLAVMGILIAVAVPCYLGFQQRASRATAEANLRNALPAVEAYHEDNLTYDSTTMTVSALRSYNQGVAAGISIVSGSATTYCIKSTQGDVSMFKNGPGAVVSTAACS